MKPDIKKSNSSTNTEKLKFRFPSDPPPSDVLSTSLESPSMNVDPFTLTITLTFTLTPQLLPTLRELLRSSRPESRFAFI